MAAYGKRLGVLIGPDGSLTPAEIMISARGLADVFFFLDSGNGTSPVLRTVAESLAPTTLADLGDYATCLTAARELKLEAVTTFTDRLCQLAHRLNQALRHQENCEVPWGRKDDQRRALREAGVSHVESVPVSDGDTLRAFAQKVGFPVVVKPTDGVASRDTWLLTGEADIDAFLSACGATLAGSQRMFAEQFIAGQEPVAPGLADYVSAEVFRPGTPSAAPGPATGHSFVTDRLPLSWPCRETGLLLPSRITPEMESLVVASAGQALDALRAGTGAFHIEMKPMLPAPEVIEVNGRLGGFIARLVRYGAGMDLGRLALSCVLGEAMEFDLHWTRCVLALLFQAPASGRRVVEAPSRREVTRMAGVVAVDEITPGNTDLDWRLGTNRAIAKLWLAAGSHQQLYSHLAEVVAFLDSRFTITDDSGNRVADRSWTDRITQLEMGR
jgi:hypothetical protein